MALDIIYMGTPDFAVPILKAIHESDHNIIHVYTQSPKKKDRGLKKNITPIQEFANKYNLKVRHPDHLDNDEEFNFFKKLRPDLVVVVAYGKIIPKRFLNIENLKFINVHASLLPRWRGAAPIQRAIMNMDKETGVSIMKIISKLDAGPVMMMSKTKISPEDNYNQLSKKLSELGSEMVIESLNLIENNKANFIEQIDNQASYAKKIQKSEAKINWEDSAKVIIAKINALSPYPGTWFDYKGSRLKILKAIEIEAKELPGTIINKNFTIACSSNAVQILEIQKEGKKKMSISDFLKGNNLEIGLNVK